MDHSKRFKEGIDNIHDQQEKGRWRNQRQHDAEETSPEVRAINRSGLDHRSGDGLERCKKEQAVVADAPLGGCHDHQAHRFLII